MPFRITRGLSTATRGVQPPTGLRSGIFELLATVQARQPAAANPDGGRGFDESYGLKFCFEPPQSRHCIDNGNRCEIFCRVVMWRPDDTYAIARIDLPGASTHGWQVRFQRRGKKFAKYFADGQWGGARGAYHAARAWRDELIRRVDKEAMAARICRKSVRNSSGVVGVSRVAISSSNGSTYHFWQAAWCPAPGERRCVKFSIRRHGDREAFRLAVEARREGVGG